MKRPQSNGLFEVAGGQEKEHGFCCMKLILFLSANNVTSWDEWHGAHLSAMSGDARTLRNVRFMRER